MARTLEEKRRESLTAEWESYCDNRKGCFTGCCHHEGSPCEELKWTDKAKGIGVCKVYFTRFGKHKTVEGKEFNCVPMWQKLLDEGAPLHCGYSVVTSIQGKPVPQPASFTV